MIIPRVWKSLFLDAVLRGIPFNPPPVVWIGLWRGDPEADGEEVRGNAYERRIVLFDLPDSNLNYYSRNRVEFAAAVPGSWGEVTHAAIFDAKEGGNLIFAQPMAAPKAIEAGDIFYFDVREILVKFKE